MIIRINIYLLSSKNESESENENESGNETDKTNESNSSYVFY